MIDAAAVSGKLQALLDHLVAEEVHVPGGILRVNGPSLRWRGASGIAIPEGNVAMSPDDRFVIDSIGKTMTATIVMKLVEAGRLALDDPIGRHAPSTLLDGLLDFNRQPFAETVTLRHLLGHASGLADDWNHPGFLDLIIADPKRRWTPEETIEYVKRNCDPTFPPGGGFRYSDPGYNLIGLAVEAVAGRPLHVVLREMLLEPLGMDDTYWPSHEEPRPPATNEQVSRRFLEDMECTLWPAVITANWAGGALVSTAEDLDRFFRAFVRGELFDDPATRDRMLDWRESGPYHDYGFGVSRVDFDRSPTPGHAGLGEVWGHTGSSHNFMYYWPGVDVTLIGTLNQIVCDRTVYDTVAAIMREIRESTDGAPPG